MAAKKNKKTAEKKEPKKTAPRKAAKKADAKKAPAKKAAKKGGAKKGVGKGCTVKRCAGVVAKAAKTGSEQSKQTVAEAKIPCPKKPAKKKGKKSGAKKAAAKKPAAKKAAKKAPKKAAKKAKKPKAPQRVAESRMAARVAKGLGVSQDTAESVLKAGKSSVLKEGETGPGLRARKAPDKSKEVKSRTVSRKQAIATVAHYMNVSQKEAEAFLNANSNLVNDSGSKRFLNPLPEDLQRVNNPNFTAGQTAVAVITTGVAFTLADIVDRIVATRKVGDCEFHGIAAEQKILQRPGALRLGIQAGVSVLGFGGAWFAGKKDMPMTQAILGGVATGFGIKFVSDVMIKWALPKVFSAKQDEKKLGTRIYSTYQDDVQKQLDDTLKGVDEKCKAKDTAGANQVLRAHRLRALGLSTSNETTPANRQIGVAGAPAGQQGRTSPQPGPRPAPKAYKETPVGVAGAPVRGEPV
ncbi:MAG: Histone H1-like nucleoprotein, partial [Pseudomonadota bacterium]|nr:Histone H1-like nucleoprotein [Pseudomonadota bacterium]